MSKLETAFRDLAGMDELAKGDSAVHRLHPLSKLLITIVYIVAVLSFPNTEVSGLFAMILFPVCFYALSGISMSTCFYRLRFVLPLVMAVGIWNPILDREPVLSVGALQVSAGMLSCIVLLLKGVFALTASFLFVAVTGIERICYALRLLRVPKIMVTMLLITYRYISLLLEEADTMRTAYTLQAPGQKGVHISAWGSFLGSLLLRSMDRASELYQSMQLRGFEGEFYYVGKQKAKMRDILCPAIVCGLILVFRLVPVAKLLGGLLV